MKNLTFLLVVMLTGLSTLQAQIKRQYQDENHRNQTVVVKDGDMSDMDILNSQFNLDDYSLGDVIMITTEGKVEVQSQNTAPTTPNSITEEPIVPSKIEEEPTPIEEEVIVAQVEETVEKEAVVEKEPKAVAVSSEKTTTRSSISKSTTSSSRRTSSYKKKKKRTFIKLPKRKKVRKNRFSSCYSF